MTQYIDVLIAEIERRIKIAKMSRATKGIKNARRYAFKKILSFLNTLEVKEMDGNAGCSC